MTHVMSYNLRSLKSTPTVNVPICTEYTGWLGVFSLVARLALKMSWQLLHISGSNVHLVGIIGKQRSYIVAIPPVP